MNHEIKIKIKNHTIIVGWISHQRDGSRESHGAIVVGPIPFATKKEKFHCIKVRT